MNHPELAAIESALFSLAPAPASVDRDRLMFFAGRASGRRGRWLWCGSGAAVAAAIAVVVFFAGILPTSEVNMQVVYLPIAPAPTASVPEQVRGSSSTAVVPSSSDSVSWNSTGEGYLRLHRQMLQAEQEAFPSLPPTVAYEPPLTQELLHPSAFSAPDGPGRSLLNGF